jgi:hypothetical protein
VIPRREQELKLKLYDILYDPCCEDCLYEEVFVDENGEVLSEAAQRAFKLQKVGKGNTKKVTRKYRCMAGPKKGRLVATPAACATRRDPAKVRHGRKVMRSKKGIIQRKSRVAKNKSMSKMVAKMNRRLMGKA